MGVALYLLLNAGVLWLYVRLPKRLLPLEIAACWMTAVVFYHDQLIIPSVNLHWIEVKKQVITGLIMALNRNVLDSVVAMLLMEGLLLFRTWWWWIFWFLVGSWTLTGLEYLYDWLGYVKHVHWKPWWSALLYMLLGLIMVLVRLGVRKLLEREVAQT